MEKLKVKLKNLRLVIFNFMCRILGLPNYHAALMRAAEEIGRLERDVRRLDQKNALDVRSSLDAINFDNLGSVVWIRVSDERMLRHDVFNQIRDYLKGRHKDPPILMLTGKDVDLKGLTDEDLQRVGLQRMKPSERN